jgi:hypothetical protein
MVILTPDQNFPEKNRNPKRNAVAFGTGDHHKLSHSGIGVARRCRLSLSGNRLQESLEL